MKSWLKILIISVIPIASFLDLVMFCSDTSGAEIETWLALSVIFALIACFAFSMILLGWAIVSFVRDTEEIWGRYRKGRGPFSAYEKVIIRIVKVFDYSIAWVMRDGWK